MDLYQQYLLCYKAILIIFNWKLWCPWLTIVFLRVSEMALSREVKKGSPGAGCCGELWKPNGDMYDSKKNTHYKHSDMQTKSIFIKPIQQNPLFGKWWYHKDFRNIKPQCCSTSFYSAHHLHHIWHPMISIHRYTNVIVSE